MYCVGYPRQTYKLLNDLSRKSIRSQNISFRSNGKIKTSKKDYANCFNQFFTGIGNNVAEKIHHPLKPLEGQIQSMHLLETDENEVIVITNSLLKKHLGRMKIAMC